MAKIHDRIVEVSVTPVAAADTFQITAVKYYHDRGELDAGLAYSLSFTPTTAQTSPAEIQFGELMPPPTHLRFVFPVF